MSLLEFSHLSPYKIKALNKRGGYGTNLFNDNVGNAFKPRGFWCTQGDDWKNFVLWDGVSKYDEHGAFEYKIYVPESSILIAESKHFGMMDFTPTDGKSYKPRKSILDVARELGYKAVFINEDMVAKFNHVAYYDVPSLIIANEHIDIVEKKLHKDYTVEEWAFLKKIYDYTNHELWDAYRINKERDNG